MSIKVAIVLLFTISPTWARRQEAVIAVHDAVDSAIFQAGGIQHQFDLDGYSKYLSDLADDSSEAIAEPSLVMLNASAGETVSFAKDLLCGLGVDGGAAREAKCAQVCTEAMHDVDLPPFPLNFFGGLSKKQRDKGESLLSDLDAEQKNDKIVLKTQRDFVYPFSLAAYFTCYTRSKWPLFNAWVVAPDLQHDGATREGSFGNLPKGSFEHNSYHAKYKNEFLRSGDVKGVWSDYFGFDQGHWAPDAPFRKVKELVKSTYYYVNVSPQTACLNRQEWEHLESRIRDWAVDKKVEVSVMAGPLENLPDFFVSTTKMRKKWISVLEQWRVASEVLMRGVKTSAGFKDPHWVEVTKHTTETRGSHCMLRGDDQAHDRHPEVEYGVEREGLTDLADIRSCKARTLIDAGLGNYALYLMTQAGKSENRRGVRIPLAYWKLASWQEGSKQIYCCYLMDQTGMVDMTDTGEECLSEVESSYDIVPEGMEHAGDDKCHELYSPRGGDEPEEQQAQETMDCDFSANGIGWRGAYLLEENDVDY